MGKLILMGKPKLEVPTIYEAYAGESPHKIWPKKWYECTSISKDPGIPIELTDFNGHFKEHTVTVTTRRV